jgi:hypothetical protein
MIYAVSFGGKRPSSLQGCIMMIRPLPRHFVLLPLLIGFWAIAAVHPVQAEHDKAGRAELKLLRAFKLEPTLLPDARGRLTLLVTLSPLKSEFYLRVSGLPATTRFNVFLTETTESRDLPARFLGTFSTNEDGRGMFSYTSSEDLLLATGFTEFDAVDGESPGVVDGKGDYTLDTPVELVELGAVRIYFASASDATKAGALAFDTPFSGNTGKIAGDVVLGGTIEVSSEEP